MAFSAPASSFLAPDMIRPGGIGVYHAVFIGDGHQRESSLLAGASFLAWVLAFSAPSFT